MYMPNKTISVPEDVIPIIEALDVPFSLWVADQLRRYAATRPSMSLSQQFLVDASLVDRPTTDQTRAAIERMERSAPW